MVVSFLRSAIFSGTNGRSLALLQSPSVLAAVQNSQGRRPEMDTWRTTSAKRDHHRIADSTLIGLRFASLNYIYGYFERGYSIAMGLGLYSVEHCYDISYWSALDRDPGHRDGKFGTGIHSGVQHFFGVGIHRSSCFAVFQPSDTEHGILRWSAGVVPSLDRCQHQGFDLRLDQKN